MKVIDNWGFVWSILAYMPYVYQISYRDLFVIKRKLIIVNVHRKC